MARTAAKLGGIRLVVGVISALIYLVAPFANVLAQGTDALTTNLNEEPGCESVIVLDFITDAEGESFTPGDAVEAQYWPWGVGVSATTADGVPSAAIMSTLPVAEGAVNVLGVGERMVAGRVSLAFRSLLSVESVTVVGAVVPGVRLHVYDQNAASPAVIPLAPSARAKAQAVQLASLGAATRLDVDLIGGSGIAQVVLCPQSSPKPVNRYQSPRIELAVSVNQSELRSGEITEATATVRNLGGAVGFDLTVVHDLPPGLVFADDGLRHRQWDLGAIGANGSYTLGYQLRAESRPEGAGSLTGYLVAVISNGKGAEGAASVPLTVALTPGQVLGTGTSEVPPVAPVPSPQPVVPPANEPTPPATPAGETEVSADRTDTTDKTDRTDTTDRTDRPKPAAAPTPAATPSREEREPIGGPEDEFSIPALIPDLEDSETTTEQALLGTTTATTTLAAVSCTSWLWLLGILNAVMIALVAWRERAKGKEEARSRWVVALLLVAVPLIIWYPACQLVWWLVITAIGTGVMWYALRDKGPLSGGMPVATPGGGTLPPSAPPSAPGGGAPTDLPPIISP